MNPVIFAAVGADCQTDAAPPGMTLGHARPDLKTGFVFDTPSSMPANNLVRTPVADRAAWALFGADLTFLTEVLNTVGAITLPFGLIIFALKGVSPEVDIMDLYKGALPFVLCTIIGIIFVVIFPQIALWLPNLLN